MAPQKLAVGLQPALFDSFNAKRMALRDVARTFVVPSQYREIVGLNNVVIVGPRGSGKTTLLRMLEGPALAAWTGRQAGAYRRRISYSSVFIPADRLWSSQLDPPAIVDEQSRHRFGTAAFTTHTLTSLVEVMMYRQGQSPHRNEQIHHPITLTRVMESRLVEHCARIFRLDVTGPSLEFLLSALEARSVEIARLLEELDGETDRDRLRSSIPEWFYLTLRETATAAIRAFNRAVGQPEHRWALLFDEMELAPLPVHQAIINALRGSDPSLLFKLSFSPFDGDVDFVTTLRAAMPSNDYREVSLWYGRREGASRFSSALLAQMVSETSGNRRDGAAVEPRQIFGVSKFDTTSEAWESGTAYRKGTTQFEVLRSQYMSDAGFRDYCVRMRIHPDRLDQVPKKRRASILRKIYPLLIFRSAILDFHDGRPIRRGRKKPLEAYTGSAALFAVLEGNPRWFKAVVSSLLAASPEWPIDAGLQYDQLLEASSRFEALLEMLPTAGPVSPWPRTRGDDTMVDVLDVLDRILAYISANATGRFTADPVGSFVVDEGVPPTVVAALQTALNAGAIVRLDKRGGAHEHEAVLGDIRGCRFRVAYLLCIRRNHEVPIRVGREVELSTILATTVSRAELRKASTKGRISAGRMPGQYTLPLSSESNESESDEY